MEGFWFIFFRSGKVWNVKHTNVYFFVPEFSKFKKYDIHITITFKLAVNQWTWTWWLNAQPVCVCVFMRNFQASNLSWLASQMGRMPQTSHAVVLISSTSPGNANCFMPCSVLISISECCSDILSPERSTSACNRGCYISQQNRWLGIILASFNNVPEECTGEVKWILNMILRAKWQTLH